MALDNNTQITDRNTINNWFKTGLKPNQQQFWSTWASFWHKSDTLPIGSIKGLGGLLDGKAETEHTHSEYAKNDATSLTADNVTAWQKKLGVDDLDYVEIPTENGTSESHPYVVVINDEGKSAKRNATEFGKLDTVDGIAADENKDVKLGAVRKSTSNTVEDNFDLHLEGGASVGVDAQGVKVSEGGVYSILKSEGIEIFNQTPTPAYQFQELLFPKRAVIGTEEKVYPVTYLQGVKADEKGRVDISGVAMNWTNSSQRFSGILDKSADATYNQLLGVDATGNLAKVNGKTIFVNQPDNLTDTEKTTWKTKMNGGYSTSTMSVGLITPPLVDKKDQNYWITLLGSNLNLNPSSYKVWLVSVDTNIEYEIGLNGNGGVQLYTNGTSLVFYYNFKNLPIGKYKVKLFNGVAYYTTGALYTVNVVENVVNRDLSSLTWKTKVLNDASTTSVASGNYVLFKHPESITKADDNTYVLSFLSSDFVTTDENFSIDIVFERSYSDRSTGSWVFAGLVDGSIGTPNLLNQTLCYAGFRGNGSLAVIQGFANNQNTSFTSSGTYIYSYNIKITMIRQGNQLTVVYVGSNGTAFSSTTVPTGPMKIGLYVQNCAMSNHTGGITLSNFFTF